MFLAVTGKYVVSRNFLFSGTLWYKLVVDLLSCSEGELGSEEAELWGENTGIPVLAYALILILLKRNYSLNYKIIPCPCEPHYHPQTRKANSNFVYIYKRYGIFGLS